MPRPSRKAPTDQEVPAAVAPGATNSLVASAAQVTSRKRAGTPKTEGSTGWQNEAWEALDQVGELEFYREWLANALSRVTLYVQRKLANGDKDRIAVGLPQQALEQLFGGEDGQSEMMSQFAGLLGIPGEAWLVGLLEPPSSADAPDIWRVISRDEFSRQGSTVVIDRGDGVVERYEDGSNPDKPAQVYVTRIWRPHPRRWVEAHSSVRSALPILRELIGLDKKVGADIDSRLAGAGILIVPTETTFAAPGVNQAALDPDNDPLLSTLIETMMAAIKDRGDASSVAPIVARVPAAYVDKIKHITFWSEFSGEVRSLREDAIKRLATSLDIPPEVLLGMADVNHWTGWLLDENAIKMHIEPLVGLICHGLTTRYLWPILQTANGGTLDVSAREFTIEGDTSALRQRPNRAAEAQAMHGNLVITDAALARETGFESSDLLADPSNAEEYKRRLLQKTAQGVTTADVTVAALDQLGVSLVPKASEVDAGTTTAEQVPAPAPAAPAAIESRGVPEQDTSTGNAALAASAQQVMDARLVALTLSAEGVVDRAIERARNRWTGRGGKARARAVETREVDACLVGAWERIPRIAAMTGTDPARLLSVLDGYTRGVLTAGAEHDPMSLARVLETAGLLDEPPEAIGA